MFDGKIRQYVTDIMTGESNSPFAMSGITLEDCDVRPQFKEDSGTEEKVESLLAQMTLDEKITMLGGKENLGIHGIERLDIPEIWCSDASAGIRCYGRSTAFPVPLAMAATWSRDLNRQVGEAIGEECRAKGVSVLLGPGVNIYRVPTNGRNFEYMGEDPFLAAELVVPYIQGVQSRGVITTVKHFACNNSDYDRHRMNSEVDERTLQEIYFPAFKAAVQRGGSKSVMCAYNPVNGVYASENHELLTRVLREDWGFKGFVISDWNCVYSSDGPLKAGLDLEMPYARYLNRKKLLPLLRKGRITEDMINNKIRNLMKALIEIGAYSRSRKDPAFNEYDADHSEISLQSAREAIVLLKNKDKILPLNKESLNQIVLIGFNAVNTTTCGGGSCYIKSYDKVNILDGINSMLPGSVQITSIASEKKLYKLTDQDKKQIKDADIVIVSAGFSNVEESECWDRSWKLPFGQDSLIQEASRLNQKTIVLLTAGGGVETESWINGAAALLHTFYLGQNAGKAIAEVLFGDVNPSAKLPFTMAKRWSDFESTKHYVKTPQAISFLRILGPQGSKAIRKPWTLNYSEKLMLGYRHFDTSKVEPQFPFGYGLSYTDFCLSDISLSTDSISMGESCEVEVTVKNTGKRAGAEVVQLYIHDCESSLIRPEKELKGFHKVYLEPGESEQIVLKVLPESLEFYNDGKWTSEKGFFKVMIGTGSRQITASLDLELKD